MENQIIKQQEVLGKQINIYGNIENPLFLAKDVAEWLGLTNVTDMVSRVDEDEVTKLNLGGFQGECNMLTEDGLYEILMQSRKPIAKQLKKGIKEMLHSVRVHGAYMTQDTIQKALTNPDFLIQLATELKVEQQRRIEAEETSRLQQEQLKIAAPKVQYVDEVLQSVNTYNVNLIAKELGMSAETLNKKMHDMKVIYRNGQTWVLTAKYQGKGYTKTRTHSFTRSDGTIGTSMLTVWTESGRKFIHSLFKS